MFLTSLFNINVCDIYFILVFKHYFILSFLYVLVVDCIGISHVIDIIEIN